MGEAAVPVARRTPLLVIQLLSVNSTTVPGWIVSVVPAGIFTPPSRSTTPDQLVDSSALVIVMVGVGAIGGGATGTRGGTGRLSTGGTTTEEVLLGRLWSQARRLARFTRTGRLGARAPTIVVCWPAPTNTALPLFCTCTLPSTTITVETWEARL